MPKDEQNRACAVWSMEFFNEYKPMPMPIRPQALHDYNRLGPRTKATVKHEFWEEPEVKIFIDSKWRACLHNQNCVRLLYELKREFSTLEDSPIRARIEGRIAEFRAFHVKQIEKPYQGLEPVWESTT
jgi:hypothetical protein